MHNYKISNFHSILIKEINIFRTGLFILPSAPAIAFVLIVVSLLINSLKTKASFFKDKTNLLIIIASILMLISSILQIFFLKNIYSEELNKNSSWIGLFNWIPFFWIFCSSQEFLKTKEDRECTSLILCLSTIPVIFSGIGQTFFNWHGPLELFNGTIIWYQRPIDSISGLTAQFNHANYAGAWFTFILPLCIAQSFNKTSKKIKKNFFRIILFGIISCIFLTNSRNAWGCSLLSIPLVLGTSSLQWFFPFIFFTITLILVTTQNFFESGIQNLLRDIIPNKVWQEFTNEGFKNLDVTRLEIIQEAFRLVINNPLFGTGAASFPVIYELEKGFWKGHSHNILAELSISYGIPCTIILIFFICRILIKSFQNIYITDKKNIFDRSIWTAIIIFLLSQQIDIQYFDGRISLLFWILLAGLKCINDENQNLIKNAYK
ncbi:O-antigen ligase family protein [Prochlorococcus marinus]|uniref:O-antigen ligase family protein n=1 Tax=Prochlorococcus marinus TaxID=1219 RepID=UPI0009E335A4|nr:O-antigen ligase family protein [Prochlorococcus marinus]